MKKMIMLLALVMALTLVLINFSSIIEDKVAASEPASSPVHQPPGSRDRISVRAAGPGTPSINFRHSYDVRTVYRGAAQVHLAEQRFSPSTLTSGDYDEDGVPDLLAGYSGKHGGVIALHFGNVDAIYPNSPEAQKKQKASFGFNGSAFLPQAELFEVAEAPDFLGAGDFDADGHWDAVVAARDGNALYLLPGDGRGHFGASRRIELPGRVTAMVTGEVNRADGLVDVVVAVVGAEGPNALVFEGPEGALRSKPETLSLTSEAPAMALGHLDDDYSLDLVVGAGSELLIVHGRDRKLSLDVAHQDRVPRAVLSRRSLPSPIFSIVVGDFKGDQSKDLAILLEDRSLYLLDRTKGEMRDAKGNGQEWKIDALMAQASPGVEMSGDSLACARVSGLAKDDLLVSDRANQKLHILAAVGEPVGRDDTALLSASARPQVLVSLVVDREPMAVLPMRLNADAMSDLVILRRGDSSLTVVPSAVAATLIVNSAADDDDGACEAAPGDCTLREAINGANGSAAADTINFSIGTGAQTINVTGTGLPVIDNVGGPLTIDGTTQPGFAGTPIIELNGSGAVAFANGLTINAPGSVVRGLAINRFNGDGIRVFNGQSGVIEGNFIGTDITGTIDLGNVANGVHFLLSTTGFTIGATTAQGRNLVSGNTGTGIFLNTSFGTMVQGNFIGTDITGTLALGNGFLSFGSVTLSSSNNSVIGGMTAGARNLISGNNNQAIQLDGLGSGNLLQGNIIGLDITGATNLGNRGGVAISGSSNTVGGTAEAARNIISGNNGDGVNVTLGSLNLVQGNYIGTDANGELDRGNTGTGVTITAADTAVGGTVAEARNIISGNGQAGVFIGGQAATGNQVLGNFIGTQADGGSPVGNGSFGVGVGFDSASNNIIGGTAPGSRNRIASNGADGVFVAGGTGNAIRSNSIFSNTELGIDLGSDGVTGNDSCDPDIGANNLQNFPVLTSAISSGISTNIQGTLNSTANTTFTVEFFFSVICNGSGSGEGSLSLGSTTVTTDGSCNAVINATVSFMIQAGNVITATATDSAGNTSEFSQCIQSTVACTITCPTNQTVNTGPGSSQCGAVVNYPAPSASSACGTVTCSPSSGSLFPVGATTVNCTTTAGPSCSFTVTVRDTTVPTISCPANITTTAASGHCSAVVNYTTPLTSDNCPGTTVSCSPPSGSIFLAGVTSVGCGAFDSNPNTGNCFFTVTVNANLAISPSNRNHPSSGGAAMVGVTAANGCSWTAVSNDTFITITAGASGTGNGIVSYSVAVNTGAARTGTMTVAGRTFTVTQDGAQGCTITCPAVQAVNTGQGATQCGAVVNYPAPATTGSCGPAICAPASGSFFPAGTTTVTCTSGGGPACSFSVRVNDTQPPSITCPASFPAVTDQNACPGPLCRVVNYPLPGASDNCPGVTVACNPPAGSCFPTGDTTVTCTATDASGNTASCSFLVTTFDVALEDDNNPSSVLLWNSITGQYRFCCNGTTFTGVGRAIRQGCVYTLQHNPSDRRVLGRVDKAVHTGSGSIQATAGTIRCTITDRNTLNDANLASCR